MPTVRLTEGDDSSDEAYHVSTSAHPGAGGCILRSRRRSEGKPRQSLSDRNDGRTPFGPGMEAQSQQEHPQRHAAGEEMEQIQRSPESRAPILHHQHHARVLRPGRRLSLRSYAPPANRQVQLPVLTGRPRCESLWWDSGGSELRQEGVLRRTPDGEYLLFRLQK
jgi:hypothetical protein